MDDGANTEGSAAPSRRLVDQRVRNRVMEYFDLVSSLEQQRDYERTVPFVNVPYEIINQWEDWVPQDPRVSGTHLGCYSPDEIQALCEYQAVWEMAAAALPDTFPSLSEVQIIPEWTQLTNAASTVASCFARRGTLPEDREVP